MAPHATGYEETQASRYSIREMAICDIMGDVARRWEQAMRKFKLKRFKELKLGFMRLLQAELIILMLLLMSLLRKQIILYNGLRCLLG